MAANERLVAYRVWDAPTRWFHWINALHVWLGYVMTLNLMRRFVWAFLGNRYARWRAMNQDADAAMRSLRAPFVGVHELAFYGIAAVVVLHVIVVIVTELREGGSLISAMFTGRKIFSGPPQDL
jgi:cytochrome b